MDTQNQTCAWRIRLHAYALLACLMSCLCYADLMCGKRNKQKEKRRGLGLPVFGKEKKIGWAPSWHTQPKQQVCLSFFFLLIFCFTFLVKILHERFAYFFYSIHYLCHILQRCLARTLFMSRKYYSRCEVKLKVCLQLLFHSYLFYHKILYNHPLEDTLI